MSSSTSSALTLDVEGRRTERRCILAASGLAACASTLAGLQSVAVAAVLALVGAGVLAYGFWRAGWVGSARIVRIAWLSDGRWLIAASSGRSIEGQLRADSRVGTWWVWLRWDADRVRSMLLFRGDLTEPDLRRLIVRLRIEGVGSRAQPPVQTSH
jgi:hypothetical protein